LNGDGKRNIECLTAIFHVGTGPFQYRECGVTFIDMANLGPQSQSTQEPPPGDTKDQLLFQTQLRTSPVKFRRKAAVGRGVRGIVGIEQKLMRKATSRLCTHLTIPASCQSNRCQNQMANGCAY
jgi:hypothetical protein